MKPLKFLKRVARDGAGDHDIHPEFSFAYVTRDNTGRDVTVATNGYMANLFWGRLPTNIEDKAISFKFSGEWEERCAKFAASLPEQWINLAGPTDVARVKLYANGREWDKLFEVALATSEQGAIHFIVPDRRNIMVASRDIWGDFAWVGEFKCQIDFPLEVEFPLRVTVSAHLLRLGRTWGRDEVGVIALPVNPRMPVRTGEWGDMASSIMPMTAPNRSGLSDLIHEITGLKEVIND